MMHVEIDDGHALQPMHVERVPRRHRHVVEEAEAHRLVARGMVAGRAHRAEGVGGTAGQHLVGGGHGRAGRTQRGLQRAGAHRGVGVDRIVLALVAHPLHVVEHLGHVAAGMRPRQLLQRGLRRVVKIQRNVQAGSPQVVADRVQPLRAFGMACTHIVQTTLRMTVESSAHGGPGVRFAVT
jgi:hypothetical protein